MPLLIVAIGIVALLLLIMGLKLNTFVSLIIVSFGVALALGMPLDDIVKTIEEGLGGTLGHIALIFGLGAMLGRLIADSGGAQRIAMTLVNKFGEKNIQWAVVIASFIIGVALFFEVGLVLLIPIVFAISRELKISILYLGIPMTAALSVTHGFLPPHPGPTAIAGELGANIGEVLLYGIIVAIPTVLLAGPLFTKLAKKSSRNHLRKWAASLHSVSRKRSSLKRRPASASASSQLCFRSLSCLFRLLLRLFKKRWALQTTACWQLFA